MVAMSEELFAAIEMLDGEDDCGAPYRNGDIEVGYDIGGGPSDRSGWAMAEADEPEPAF